MTDIRDAWASPIWHLWEQEGPGDATEPSCCNRQVGHPLGVCADPGWPTARGTGLSPAGWRGREQTEWCGEE